MNPAALARVADLHRQLSQVYAELARQDSQESDRVIGLADAAVRLGTTRSWLSRRENWSRVGGFKGPDRRVHFPLSALADYAHAQKH